MSGTSGQRDTRPDVGLSVGDRRVLDDSLKELRHLRERERQAAGHIHDFNNLLTAITCSSALLEDDVDRGSRAAAMVHEIQEAAERAVGLVRRMQRPLGRQEGTIAPLSVDATVHDLRSLLARVVGPEVGIDVALDAADAAVSVDRDELEQVLINLATNARHAMPSGGRLGITTSRVTFGEYEAEAFDCAAGAYLALQVLDTGVGMTPEVRARALEADFTTRAERGGRGLGLSSANRFAVESGGAIVLWSEPGAGTAVTLFLPAGEAPIDVAAPSAVEPMSRGSETILVVEADEAVRRVVCTVLEQLGYMVLDAVSGEDAIDLGRDYMSPIHLLLTDVSLPDVDGRELGPRFAALGRTVRVLTMTGHADHLAAGDDGAPVLRKAFSAIELARKIRDVLDA